MKSRFQYILAILIIIVGYTIFSGLWKRAKIVSETGNLPAEAIVFRLWEENTLGFINDLGNNFQSVEIKIPNSGLLGRRYIDFGKHIATWSVDGKYLASRVSPYNPNSGWPVLISSDGEFFYCDNEFYPWGTGRIWVIDGFNTIMQIDDEQSERVSLFNMRSCEEIEVLYEVKDQNSDEHIREAAYSLKGWLAISRWMDNHEEILLLDPSGSEKFTISGGQWPTWSPDGNYLAYSIVKDGIFITDIYGGDPYRLVTTSAGDHSPPSWSPDGKWITYHRFSKGSQNIYILDIESREEVEIYQGGVNPNWRWDFP